MEQGWAKFVSGEAEGKWLIWQITIFCDNQVQLAIIDNKQSPSSFFDKFLWEAAIFRQEQSQEGEKCAFIYAWAEYPTQLDDSHIVHEQTIICRQLSAGHMVDSRPVKRKNDLNRMIIITNLNAHKSVL